MRELRECLGPKTDDIILALQDVLAAYPDAKAFLERDFYQQWTRGMDWLRSLVASLQELSGNWTPTTRNHRGEMV